MTADEKGFLKALKKDPKDVATLSAFADWLDEHERPYEAAVQRGKAGLSEVFYKIRRKADGLFSTGKREWSGAPMGWAATGKMWRKLVDLHAHMRELTDTRSYGGTKWDNVEAVFVEVRVVYTTALPLKREKVHGRMRTTVTEPLGGKSENEE